MDAAIRHKDLIGLADRFRRGNYVDWNAFTEAAKALVVRPTGVGRINYHDREIKAAEGKINQNNRYVHTKGDVAALLGVARNTLYHWEAGGLIEIREIKQPQRRFMGRKTFDALDVLKQLKRLQKH